MLVKCPRCELNYMEDMEKVCKICYREIHGHATRDEQELCTICNEAAVMPGKEFCQVCFREINGEKIIASSDQEESEDEPLLSGNQTVSTMDEIIPDIINRDIHEPEYQQIEKDLSLEELEEQEESDNLLDEEED